MSEDFLHCIPVIPVCRKPPLGCADLYNDRDYTVL